MNLTIVFLLLGSAAAKRGCENGKRTKGSKAVCRHTPLVALLAPLPTYEGDLKPMGTVSVHYNPDDSFLVALDAAGLDPNCTQASMCNVAIYKSTSCDDPLGDDGTDPDYYAPALDISPWETDNAFADGAGFSNSAWRVSNGYGAGKNVGHAVVVYDNQFEPIGCGVLAAARRPRRRMFLEADVGVYPDYEGDITVSGSVKVIFRTDGTFKFGYNLVGLEVNCEGCGIHIHAGTSCDTNEQVLGHGWNSDTVQDLWTPAGGAVYATDGNGNAEDYFNLSNGYSFGKILGHAVVVHAQDGTRIGCGVLRGVM